MLNLWKGIGRIIFAEIAQLVEQRIRNAWVVGSNPILGSILKNETKGFELLNKVLNFLFL